LNLFIGFGHGDTRVGFSMDLFWTLGWFFEWIWTLIGFFELDFGSLTGLSLGLGLVFLQDLVLVFL